MPYSTRYQTPSYWPTGWGGADGAIAPPADDSRDLMEWAITALTSTLQAVASKSVTYARGEATADVRATYGRKLLKLQDDDGIRLEWTDMDFVIPSAELILDGQAVEPRRGDRIYLALGDRIQTFEVAPYGPEPCWAWSDPYQIMARIHTKRIEEG